MEKEFGYMVVSLNIGDLNIDPQYYNPHSKDPEMAPLVLENSVLQQRKENPSPHRDHLPDSSDC